MQLPEDQSILGALAAGAVAACGFVAMWLWNHTMGRIRALEKGKVDKETFSDFATQAEVSRKEIKDSMEQGRRETRETFISLFNKLDELKDMVRDRK